MKLCACGRAAPPGHACAVTRLRSQRDAALHAYDAAVCGHREEVTRLLEELRGEREKYRQVIEINAANERAYLATTDRLGADLAQARADLAAARPVLESSRAWVNSWHDVEAVPNRRDLPEEAALFDAASKWIGDQVDAMIEAEINAHGIPDDENDPGWPEGTPPEIIEAERARRERTEGRGGAGG